MDTILKTKNLCKKFNDQIAVNQVSLSIQKTLFMVCWDPMVLGNLQL